jgi:hypothetical protein
MVNSKIRKTNKYGFHGRQKGGVSDKRNLAIGIGTLGIAPILTKTREKITGETSYYGDVVSLKRL